MLFTAITFDRNATFLASGVLLFLCKRGRNRPARALLSAGTRAPEAMGHLAIEFRRSLWTGAHDACLWEWLLAAQEKGEGRFFRLTAAYKQYQTIVHQFQPVYIYK